MICAVWKKQTLYWEYHSYKHTTQKSIRKEVKIIKCLPLCGRNTKLKERQKVKKEKRVVILKEKKIVK